VVGNVSWGEVKKITRFALLYIVKYAVSFCTSYEKEVLYCSKFDSAYIAKCPLKGGEIKNFAVMSWPPKTVPLFVD